MDNGRPRLLILDGKHCEAFPIDAALNPIFDIERAPDAETALNLLRDHDFHAVLTDAGDFLPLERGLVGSQAALVLDTIGEGICIVDADGRLLWTNRKMRSFDAEVLDRVVAIAQQACSIFLSGVGESPQSPSRANGSGKAQGPAPDVANGRDRRRIEFESSGDRYYEVMTSCVRDERGRPQKVVAVVWDATAARRMQQKIDAIDAAGRELARLDTESIATLNPTERLRWLRDKIVGFSRDLMHFDHFAIRVLNHRSNELEVAIADGLPAEAMDVDIYASAQGNGISGYVAATGRSIICHDTEKDARYLLGLAHCKSSLTVPLMLHENVIGVYNIESQTPHAFTEEDRQFAEIFGRYIAIALNTLNLLVAERCQATSSIADNVVQETAEPLNDIVTEVARLREAVAGEGNAKAGLDAILERVELVKRRMADTARGSTTVLGLRDRDDSARDPMLEGRRVLIADDEASLRQTIRDVLAKQGCTCFLAKEGREAVGIIDREPLDLVLSDIKMPYRNGYEIFAAAKRHQSDLPVVLMTGFGYDPNHSIVRASEEGLTSVLFKPFEVKLLLDEARKALAGRFQGQAAGDAGDR